MVDVILGLQWGDEGKGKIVDYFAPNYDIVTSALSKTKNNNFPVAFCLDWGITKNGETILIEMNDGFSFGHYGLHHCYVAQMLSARWFELTK